MQTTTISEYGNSNKWERILSLNEVKENQNTYYTITGMSFGKKYKTLKGAKTALTRNGYALIKVYEE